MNIYTDKKTVVPLYYRAKKKELNSIKKIMKQSEIDINFQAFRILVKKI